MLIPAVEAKEEKGRDNEGHVVCLAEWRLADEVRRLKPHDTADAHEQERWFHLDPAQHRNGLLSDGS